MQRRWLFPGLLFILLSLGFAAAEGEELERNRRRLEKWKGDPARHQRLKQDLSAFYSLPGERQEAVRTLDQYVHEADPTTQARLWGVLDRYSEWVEKLPQPERRALLEAPNREQRLGVVRALKQREWIDRLPKRIRDELDRLPAERRVSRLTGLRLEEQRQRVLWQRSGGEDQIPRPTRMAELPAEVQAFVKTHLSFPRLGKPEEKMLKLAEGKWPEFPKALAALADRYPVYPEGPLGKITRPDQLPESLRGLYRPEKFGKKGKGFGMGPGMGAVRPQAAVGKWPEFALLVAEMMRHERVHVPLGASKLAEFPSPTREFLERDLIPSLSMTERGELETLAGRWPDYPRRLLWLARRHQKVIPGMSLPGPPAMWDAARVARMELSDDERAGIEWLAIDLEAGKEKGRHGTPPMHFPKKGWGGPGGPPKGGR